MKQFTNIELQEIYDNINQGTEYCGIDTANRGVGHIYKPNDYICWQHYGSSANKNTVEDLKWLLENIFDDCITVTPCEWSDYHINHVPIDPQYKGIDYSRSHPNTYGL